MRIDVLTLFPELFEPYFAHGMVGRASNAGIVQLRTVNFREFASDRHHRVDDRPFGGGPGMVLACEPIFRAVEHLDQDSEGAAGFRILLTPQGEPFTQSLAQEFSRLSRLILICGHYEGFDERIREGLDAREVSIGDYVLSGGEPAAMVLMDAVVRLLPGALGDSLSSADESFSSGWLEYPQYTRPREFRGMTVPEVLLSGDHARIETWRRREAVQRTMTRRPDLVGRKEMSDESFVHQAR